MKKAFLLLTSILFLQLSYSQNAPVAGNDSFTINKNNQVTFPVLSNDFDVDGDPLSISIFILPLHGTATVSGNQVTYLPNLNYVGADSLSYIVCDTTNRCDTAIVFITVLNVNNAPVAVDDNYTILQNTPTTLPITSNDYDPDGDVLSISILTLPANGTASMSGLQITYTPNQFYFGTDSFVYVICDTANLCDTASVYIIVSGSNFPPVTVDDNYTFGDTLTSVALDILTNDNDPEGNAFNLSSVNDINSALNLGTLSIDSANRRLIFSRNGITCGTESFEYVICDYSMCDTGIVTINITCPENISLTEGFSPDGDGLNDKLVFRRLEYFSPAVLKVFNRYGTMVYENEYYKNDWDGTYLESNKPLPDGTYFYILRLADNRDYNNYLIINR